MNVELISVGTELLLGDILNSNAQYLSKELAAMGINVFGQSTVGDNIDRLVERFDLAFRNADIVITTGGLGPTGDDITKEAAAKYFSQELVVFDDEWEKILDKCAKFSGSRERVPKNNIRQGMFTKNATILDNDNGTAPGAVFTDGEKRIIMLPGPPFEMKSMFRDRVVPYLMKEMDGILVSRYVRFYGIGESQLEIDIMDILNSQTNPTVALYAKEGEVLLRVTAKGDSEDECLRMIDNKIDEVRNIAGKYIYLIGDDSVSESQTELHNVVANLLIEKKKTIAVSESCTGGMVSAQLINFAGISESLIEGAVTYSNDAKHRRLGVSLDTLEKYGAVSYQTAEEMAKGVALTSGADIGISTTGIAGPGGGSEEKPVGLVYFGIYYNGEVKSFKKVFSGNREKIRKRATSYALNMARELLVEI